MTEMPPCRAEMPRATVGPRVFCSLDAGHKCGHSWPLPPEPAPESERASPHRHKHGGPR